MSIVQQLSEKRKRQCTKLVELSRAVIRDVFDKFSPEESGIIWTGGKDSSLTLWCIRQVCMEQDRKIPRSLFIGKGDDLEEIEDFVRTYSKRWNVRLDICRNEDVLKAANYTVGATIDVRDLNEHNRRELERIGLNESEFQFETESYTGIHLMETVVLNQWIERNGIKALFQGRRWDEHPARFDDEYLEHVEGSSSVPEHTLVNPLLHFTERDLWSTYAAFDIPFCSLYESGYRSLGTKSSTSRVSRIPAWQQDLDNTEEQGGLHDRKMAMERLRKLGYM